MNQPPDHGPRGAAREVLAPTLRSLEWDGLATRVVTPTPDLSSGSSA